MSELAGHNLFDDEIEIVKAKNQACPVDLAAFQRRIDRVAGKTPDGKSKVRLVWGQDFNATRMIVCGEWRMRYPFYRYEEGGKILDIGTPRFYVEELHPNEELRKDGSWERARWEWDSDSLQRVDVLGPAPEGGFYSAVFMIAHHDDKCCGGAGHVKYVQCLGGYRPPNDSDIERIRRAIWNRDHAPKSEIEPSGELVHKRTMDRIEKRDERRSTELRERLEDWTKTHAHTWTNDDPSLAKWGKYHFTGGHNKSGSAKETADVSSNDDTA